MSMVTKSRSASAAPTPSWRAFARSRRDPATGAAATALGGYLALRDPRGDARLAWTVEQGFAMGRPSIIEVEADKRGGAVTEIRVGGASVMVSEGDFDVP